MSIIVDIIILAIIALCVFLGYKRGLVGVAFKIFSFIIAIAISLIFYKPIAGYIIDNTKLDESISQKVVEVMNKNEEEKESSSQEEENSNVSSVIVKHINESVENATQEAKDSIVESASYGIATSIIRFGVMIILFIVTNILLLIVKAFTNFLTDLPILKQFNELGGILYGLIEGLFFVYVLLAIFSFISIGNIQEIISNSYIGSILYNYNLILMILF